MPTLTATKTAAVALAAALTSGGITAVVISSTGVPAVVVVAQSEHTFYTGVTLPDGGPEFANRSCGRVLDPFDASIVAEPCSSDGAALNAAETACAKAYFKCVVLPRVVKAADR